MGWARGSQVLDKLAQALAEEAEIDDHARQRLVESFIETLEGCDADTLDECFGVYAWLDRALVMKGWGDDDDDDLGG